MSGHSAPDSFKNFSVLFSEGSEKIKTQNHSKSLKGWGGGRSQHLERVSMFCFIELGVHYSICRIDEKKSISQKLVSKQCCSLPKHLSD